ncbi:MAG: radical SAM protein, partial [Proteobacteria bacterium]|nr:radical SAM protein [Pseudomonadota bacterium]
LDDMISEHVLSGVDFSLNSHYQGVVYGLGAEVISRPALERIKSEELSSEQKGLGTLYLHHHGDRYRTYYRSASTAAPHFRVSIDFEPDIRVVSEILSGVSKIDNDHVVSFLGTRPDLTASQEIMVPAEVSLEKVLLFPDKVQALRLNNCVTFDATYPISVELSLTNRCNHHCLWCSDADLRERLGGELSPEVLYPLFDDLKAGGTRGVVIEGGGEPTLHPDFMPVVTRAGESGLALGLITNGYLTPYLDRMEFFEWIRVSLDASDRDQYRRLKRVDGFNRVIQNLMALAARKMPVTLGVGYVLTNRNDDPVKLEQLVLFLRKIGLNYIHIRPVVDHPKLRSSADLDFLKKYETTSFSVNLSAMADNRESGNLGLPCLAHSLSAVITADGGIYLCGRLNSNASWEPVGNILEQSFFEVWTGDRRRRQVSLVSEPEFCRRHCPQCRMTKYNRLLNDMERVQTRNFI